MQQQTILIKIVLAADHRKKNGNTVNIKQGSNQL